VKERDAISALHQELERIKVNGKSQERLKTSLLTSKDYDAKGKSLK
jgi:hypothetical protein